MQSRDRTPGEHLADRYELESQIGRGGIGEVWKARHLILGSRVAIKFLVGAVKPGGAQRFLAEARIAATIKSRHAVQVFDFGVTDDGHPFLVMELLEGESLADRLARGPLSAEATVILLAQAARALDQAHALGVVHRDFKPENAVISLDRDGQEELKVVDFGIAKLLGETESAWTMPTPLRVDAARSGRTVGVLGTPAYMSPEQVRSSTIGAGCDVWALGVVAFQCLTGTLPFGDGNCDGGLPALFRAIVEGERPSARERVPSLPDGFDGWFARACATEPAGRFPTATSAIVELREVLGMMPEAPRSASVLPPVREESLELAPTLAAATIADPNVVRRTRPTRWLVATGLAMLALVAVMVIRAGVHPVASTPRSAASVASRAPFAPTAEPTTTILDAPQPVSPSPEAVQAYRAGLTAYREGTFAAIHADFHRALELDPTLAAAWLRLAIVDYWNDRLGDARESFQKAQSLRVMLVDVDLELLDGFEPLIGRDPSDADELERRMRALASKHPGNAEVLLYLAKAADERGDFAAAVESLRRVTELDPGWAVARILLGLDLAYLGNMEQAIAEFGRCAGFPSTASACAVSRARILAFAGRCTEAEAEIRDLIAKAPTSPTPYEELANALASLGRPAAAVAELLKQAEARFPDELRATNKLDDDVRQALWLGQFDEATKKAEALARATSSASSEAEHAPAARYLLAIDLETGQAARASVLAKDYLGRREGWIPSVRHADVDLASALEIPILAVLHGSGQLSKDALDERRDAWAHSWEASANSNDRRYVWYQAYAGVAQTPEQARRALDALPKYAPLPPYSAISWRGMEGHARLLAGDATGALPVLESAAAECRVLFDPVLHIHAELDLGLAREHNGDVSGACKAYRSVLDRWGRARPRSVTADTARAHARALRCH